MYLHTTMILNYNLYNLQKYLWTNLYNNKQYYRQKIIEREAKYFRTSGYSDRFSRHKIDPLVIGFSGIKRCQNPQVIQIVQKAKKRPQRG